MDGKTGIALEDIAQAFRRSAYNAYGNVLVGNAPEKVKLAFARMKEPVVGDWVIEASTIARSRGTSDIDAIGILQEIAWEKVEFSGDLDFVWDEDVEGRPHPTERVYYIRTIDGRRFRWTNASMIAVLTDIRP